MSLKTVVHFCAVRPFYVIGFWIFLMVAAGFLSQLYLDDALKGGQGPTRDLEFALAQKLKDEKLSTPQIMSSTRSSCRDSPASSGLPNQKISTKIVQTGDQRLSPLSGATLCNYSVLLYSWASDVNV